MNVKEFRAKAYTRNSEGNPVPVENKPVEDKAVNNSNTFKKTVFTEDIKAQNLTQKKPSPSQALDNTVDYLKNGGLLKVPVDALLLGAQAQTKHAFHVVAMEL